METEKRDIKKLTITLPVEESDRERFRICAPHAEIVFTTEEAVTGANCDGADAIIGLVPPSLLRYAPGLRWLGLPNAGTEGYTTPGLLPEGAVLTCCSGVYGVTVSEHMLSMLLALQKNLIGYIRGTEAERKASVRTVFGSTVLVIGLGDIGGHFAAAVKALGAYVIGVKKHPGKAKPFADEIFTPEALPVLLPLADTVALALPGGADTSGIIGNDELRLMKRGALIINAGRGSAIDTEALCSALLEGRIGGAGLDVTDPEPLPPGHPLRHMPNTIITPHTAGLRATPFNMKRIIELSLENLRRLTSGLPLRSTVDLKTGYAISETEESL